MTKEEWESKILETIVAEESSDPGRGGETPLTKLADEFASLGSNSPDSVTAARAFVSLIGRFDSREGYWSGISFLSQYLPALDRQQLRPVLRARLFGVKPLSDSLKVYALMALIEAGGRVTPRQLTETLRGLKRVEPTAW